MRGHRDPARASIALEEGSDYVKLMGPGAPLADGTEVPLTLVCERAGGIDLELPARRPIGAAADRGRPGGRPGGRPDHAGREIRGSRRGVNGPAGPAGAAMFSRSAASAGHVRVCAGQAGRQTCSARSA